MMDPNCVARRGVVGTMLGEALQMFQLSLFQGIWLIHRFTLPVFVERTEAKNAFLLDALWS